MPIGRVAHTHLPYCLQKTTDGSWLLLNRNYKPLGTVGTEHVDYDNHPDRLKIHHKTISALQQHATGVIPDQPGDLGLFFLYDDGCMPTESAAHWSRYSAILQILISAKVMR